MAYRALFNKTRKPRYLDDALNAIDGALEEYREAKAAYYVEGAERLHGKLLALKDKR